MTDKETAEHLRQYVTETHMPFSWPTDACGHDQHIRFVKHRNENWRGGNQDEWKRFVLDYANALDKAESDRDVKVVSRWIGDIEAAEDRAKQEQHEDSYWDDPLRATNKC